MFRSQKSLRSNYKSVDCSPTQDCNRIKRRQNESFYSKHYYYAIFLLFNKMFETHVRYIYEQPKGTVPNIKFNYKCNKNASCPFGVKKKVSDAFCHM
jgi:hypothetical protein